MDIFNAFYLLHSYNPSFLNCLCFSMVSFRGPKELGPRPDRSPLGVSFRRASPPLSQTRQDNVQTMFYLESYTVICGGAPPPTPGLWERRKWPMYRALNKSHYCYITGNLFPTTRALIDQLRGHMTSNNETVSRQNL